MLDFPLTLWVKLPVVDRTHPQSNKFATGVENKATGDSKLNESPAYCCHSTQLLKPWYTIIMTVSLWSDADNIIYH